MFIRPAKAAVVIISLSITALAWAGPVEDFKAAASALDAGDYNKALKLLQPLAKQGVPGAMYVLGVMYSEGKGVPKDYAAALAWHRQAADRGHPLSQYEIGVMYDRGLGVRKDPSEAFKWFGRAAELGYAMAQVNLGALYATGEGIPQNYVEAYKWFSIAATGGSYLEDTKSAETVKTDAAKRRDAIASRLTLTQLADATRLVREWKPKPNPAALGNILALATTSGASPPSASSSAPPTSSTSSQHAAPPEVPEGDAWNTGSVFAAGNQCELKGLMSQNQTTPLMASIMKRVASSYALGIRTGYEEGLKRSAVYSRNAGTWVSININQETCRQIAYAVNQYRIIYDTLK
jgi:uncharacterized protein